MATIASALIVTAPHTVELGTVELPEPGSGEVLLETLFSSISPGTELRCLAGKQQGAAFPFVPGYSMIGRVVRAGRSSGIAEGTIGFAMGSEHAAGAHLMWGAHMSHAVCGAARLQVLPDDIDRTEAVVSKLASIPYHGLRLCRPLSEERVAVVGLGAIGHCAAKLYTLAGAHTVACDLSPRRVEAARAAGIEAVVAGSSLKLAFADVFPDGADVVVDCTGIASVLPHALELCRELPWGDHEKAGPRYVVQGSYPDSFSVPYGGAFLREMTFIVPRSEQDRDRRVIHDLLRRGALSLKSIVSGVRKPKDAAEVYRALGDPATDLMTVVFDWS